MRRLPFVLPLAVLTACATAPQPQPSVPPASLRDFRSIAEANAKAARDYCDAVIADAIARTPNLAAIELQASLARRLERWSEQSAVQVGDAAFESASLRSAAVTADEKAEIAALEQESTRLRGARACVIQNLENLGSIGYRRRVANSSPGVDTPTIDVQQGSLAPTERPLAVAIDGEGFFAVRLPDGGTGYTRDGSFQVNANGNLVTSQGHILLTEITVPTDTLDISIDSSGRVFVARASVPDTSVEIGRIVLARFPSPQFVASVSATSFAETAASAEPILCEPGQHGVGVLRQRCLENSNAIQLREVEALREVDERLVALHARLGWLRPPAASSDRTTASK
ncbi:MAG: flagellar hook basal-body protein [Planctomycetota bacterium]